MGNCCVSSTTKEPENSIRKTLPSTHPLPEEETVKEVLSETPTVRKNPPPVLANGSHQPKNSPPLPEEKRLQSDKKPSAGMVFNSDGLSEAVFASEICGSVPMTTATDKRDREDDVGEARRRSPARVQKWSVPDKGGIGRSPSRRFEPSPGRARSGPGSPGNVLRMENGESSGGLRSRSPTMHAENGNARAGLGRSPSARKTGKSLDRVRSELGDKNRRLEESYSSRDSREKWPPTYSNESLENPLVSLECFIFL